MTPRTAPLSILVLWTSGLSIASVGLALVPFVSTDVGQPSDFWIAIGGAAAFGILAAVGVAELVHRMAKSN